MAEAAQQLNDDDAFAEAFGQAVAAVDAGSTPTEGKNEPAVPAKNAETEQKDGKEGEAGDEGSATPASGSEAAAKGAGSVGEGDGSGGATNAGEVSGAGGSEGTPTAKSAATSDDIASLKEEIKALAKPAAKEPAEEPKEVEKKIEEPKGYEFSPDEQKVLENYNKEWDEHAKVFEIREKRLVHDITQQLSHRFTIALDSVLQQIEQGLAPIVKGHVESAQERHVSAIRTAHPDFESVKGELPAWIAKQPKYLQQTLKSTYEQGSTEDVVELFSMFKKDTGRAQPQSQSTPSGKQAPKKDVVPTEKVASMAPVTSKRTVVEPVGIDTSDYDSAFAEALAAMKGQ